ncbi:MAG: twin-arginine translocase subunit TatC [Brevundimonas sp.]|jgi:sec-independent protein translocase protein TatC|uniref:twin-arginine translocase subunit TatC n=1 Tax=Brevundimonas sp. TaxID=1871086 RepID=UPI00391B05D4
MNLPLDDDADIEASRAPLLDHLRELRKRLIICAAAFLVGFLVCFVFAEPLYLVLVKPFSAAYALYSASAGEGVSPLDLIMVTAGLAPVPAEGSGVVSLISTGPLEILITKIKLAAFGAIVLTFPVIATQLYRFVAPGLYRRERRAFLPFLIAAPVLFCIGAAMVYFIMLPFVMWFSLSQQIVTSEVSVELLPKVSEYLSLVTALLLAFGLCFQLPVIMSLLGMAGLVSASAMAKGRRYAIVGIFVIAAFVTPPDPISQTLLGLPLLLLYEVSIWCVRLMERRRAAEDALHA